MHKGKTFIAIIPARGGSKRLPRKNILELAGRPLIGWTIDAALHSRYIDCVVVSSDDDEILYVAKQEGAECIRRPDSLAKDTSSSFDVIKHALGEFGRFDYVMLLQPTSPLRTNRHIDEAVELLFEKQAASIISVTPMDHSPLWANTLPDDLNMAGFLRDEVKGKRSQDLPTYYHLNGAIYLGEIEKLFRHNTFMLGEGGFAYKMCKAASIDIDDAHDLAMAKFMVSSFTRHEK